MFYKFLNFNNDYHLVKLNNSIKNKFLTSFLIGLDSTADSSAGTWDPDLIDEIAFTSLRSGKTVDFDHIDLSTSEFQFLEYTWFKENTNNFQFWSAELRARLRAHGESVAELE